LKIASKFEERQSTQIGERLRETRPHQCAKASQKLTLEHIMSPMNRSPEQSCGSWGGMVERVGCPPLFEVSDQERATRNSTVRFMGALRSIPQSLDKGRKPSSWAAMTNESVGQENLDTSSHLDGKIMQLSGRLRICPSTMGIHSQDNHEFPPHKTGLSGTKEIPAKESHLAAVKPRLDLRKESTLFISPSSNKRSIYPSLGCRSPTLTPSRRQHQGKARFCESPFSKRAAMRGDSQVQPSSLSVKALPREIELFHDGLDALTHGRKDP